MHWIDQCLGSLRNSSMPVHTIVIDNLSQDGTPDYIAANYPQVTLIRSGENLGFGKANNIGLRKAVADNADYVFLLNQDAWVQEQTLEILCATAAQHPNFGILSPLHLDYKGENLEFYFTTIVSPTQCPNLINDFYLSNFKQEVYDIDFVHAAGWLISKNCLLSVGGFDPIFFHYSEDVDYINRVKFWGFKIGIVPSSIFFHYGTHAGLDKGRVIAFESNFCVIQLKDIRYKLLGSILVFIKKYFDIFTSNLLYRRWKDLVFDCKVFINVIFKFSELVKSRNAAVKKTAFL